ncbi:putative actin-like microsporidial-specific protein [Hamiltosporidium tvaerminnensis]|uniref:Putative actin-like microsporidial-specific protein n=1 Tax=Hamiltosporidium tvaerminnensis TaxID=1176355 RepID=A0A4V6MVP8_9MICR|nr:putative actin-like microsporidial-specific protein [Hamiltosporidium tvaerminnensis]
MPQQNILKNFTIPTVDQITTPNKNIQSYFMKSDSSYYVQDKYKYPNYKEETDNFLTISIPTQTALIGSSLFAFEKCNLENFYNQTNINSNIFTSLNFAIKYFDTRLVLPYTSLRDVHLSLCIPDFLTRSEIIALCDYFINLRNCKSILILPVSLSLCFSLNISNCILIMEFSDYFTFTFIEDNCLVDKNIMFKNSSTKKIKPFYIEDATDFVDDFNKMKLYENRSSIYSCNLCSYKNCVRGDTICHIKTEHIVDSNCQCGEVIEDLDEHVATHFIEDFGDIVDLKSTNILENIFFMIENDLSTEKIKKICTNFIFLRNFESNENFYENFCTNLQNEINTKLSKYDVVPKFHVLEDNSLSLLAYKGTNIFSSLECSKEIVMTDKEWNSFRLRILKEKVLFII